VDMPNIIAIAISSLRVLDVNDTKITGKMSLVSCQPLHGIVEYGPQTLRNSENPPIVID